MAASGSPPTPDDRAVPDASSELESPYAVDLGAVLGVFVRGRHDPSWRAAPDGSWWWSTRTPDGPASLRLTSAHAGRVAAAAWGPGAHWVVDDVPVLLGFDDDASGFPDHELPEVLQEPWRRMRDRWRVPRSRRVMEALIAAVFEQKVTGIESRRAWRALLVGTGDAAPGPAPPGMRVLPEPRELRSVPSWQWHRWGSRPQQADTIMRALAVAGRVEQCVDLPASDARRRLMAIDGVGEWTAAEVGARALGDADAVSFGDFHLAGQLVYAFTGRRDGTDADMALHLEPFVGHRHRVQRLVELSGISRPARGPRASVTDHRRR